MADIYIIPNQDLNRRTWTPEKTLTYGANDTEKSFTVDTTGSVLVNAVVAISDLTNSVTATLAITNDHSRTVFSKASIAENTTTRFALTAGNDVSPLLMAGNMTFTVTLSGAPGGNGGTVAVGLETM